MSMTVYVLPEDLDIANLCTARSYMIGWLSGLPNVNVLELWDKDIKTVLSIIGFLDSESSLVSFSASVLSLWAIVIFI